MAVVEHRLIPARVRSDWARLRCKRLASIWAPASQDASHVGHAGVGLLVCVVPLFRCLLLPLFIFSVFLIVVGLFVVCFLWVVVGLCIWLVFMAIRRLIVSPVCWLVTSTWSPPRFLAWQKRSWLGSGLIWRRLGPLLLVKLLGLPVGKIRGLP